MPILETKKLLKKFDGVSAVDHLSVKIEEGKITGVVGPNGSGKSTLVNLLTGVLPIDGGEVVVMRGTELQKVNAYNVYTYGITRTFQNVRLFEQMSVLDNVLLALTERNVFSSLFERHKKFHIDEAEKVLNIVGLIDKKNKNAEELSYGQRKLLEIARVLAMDSDVILLDEPFAGLFPEMVKTVEGVIKRLQSEGKTIVLIEHNMDIIRELCDHLIVMDAGKLLAEGKPEAVLSNKDVTEAYLGE